MEALVFFASIASFILAIKYTREKYEQGEGYIAIPRMALFVIFVEFIKIQHFSNDGFALIFLSSIAVSLTFGFFISLDRVNRRRVSILREIDSVYVDEISKILELDDGQKYKLKEIFRCPEEKL